VQLVLTTFSPSLGCPKFFTHWTWGNGSNILVLLWCTLALLLSTQIRYPNVFLATALHHLNTHYLIIQLLPRSQSLLCHTSSTPSQHSLPHPTTPPTLPVSSLSHLKILSNCPNTPSEFWSCPHLASVLVHTITNVISHFWSVSHHPQKICRFSIPQEIRLKWKLAPRGDWQSTLHNWRFWQFQTHATQKLGQISKMRPDQI